MLYWQLFVSFFQIGLFSFGGGMAAVPLIQQQVVNGHGWLTMSEFTDLITIAEMTPGPIAVNSSTFVGMRIAGIPGALVATFSCIAPACLIVSLLAWLYFKYQNLAYIQGTLAGLRPAVVALIASAGVSILSLAVFGDGVASAAAFNWLGAGLFVAAFVVYVHSAISDLASRARRYPLCILAIMLKTYLASNARVDTHCAFCKFQRCCLLQKLVGQHPKPFNDFFKIGYAPAELDITLSWKVKQGFFGFPRKFLLGSF